MRAPQSTIVGTEPSPSATASAAPPRPAAGTAARGRGRPRGSNADPGGDLDEQPVERVGGRLGAGVEPVDETELGIGAEAEDRGLVTGEVGEADAVDDRRRARRGARTSAQAAVRTDVPEPPLGDHSATSTEVTSLPGHA